MITYPYNSPIILNDTVFVEYGGKKGSFSNKQLESSYLMSEMWVSRYVGTLLHPTIVSGTYPYAGMKRVVTDYGYVNEILDVAIASVDGLSSSGNLKVNSGVAFIYDDTFGYVDVKQVMSVCRMSWYPLSFLPFSNPYMLRITYIAGLPTGTSTKPGVLEALTIMAQIDLNEKDPGNAGMNEGIGDVGIMKFSDLGYNEERKPSDLRKTILGSSPKSNYAARLLDVTVRKARPILRV